MDRQEIAYLLVSVVFIPSVILVEPEGQKMLSDQSAKHMEKFGWFKNRHVNLRDKYPDFYEYILENQRFSKFSTDISAIEPFLSEFSGINFRHGHNNEDSASIHLKSKFTNIIDDIFRMSSSIGLLLIPVGHAFSEFGLYIDTQGTIYLAQDDDRCLIILGNTWKGIDSLLLIDDDTNSKKFKRVSVRPILR